MKTSLIIARYNEDISWLNEYKKFNLFIYNKGEDLSNKDFQNIIKLPNVGRESHTWLYHIVSNYKNLDENNIFLQGRINDLGCMVHKDINLYFEDLKKYGFSVSRFGLLGPLHWDIDVRLQKDYRYKNKFKNGEIKKSDLTFREFAKKIFPNIPYFINTSYGGCFAVSKNKILKNSFDFYQNLLNILSKSSNPIEGHYMERLWCYMFIKNDRFFDSITDVLKTKYERFI